MINVIIISLKIVVSTSILKSIVQGVLPTAQVFCLTPPGMCPGHFDLKPEGVKKIEKADLIIYQGWEKWIEKIEKKKIKLGIMENLMIPDNHKKAVLRFAKIIDSLYPDEKLETESYCRKIDSVKAVILEKAKVLRDKKVICNIYQKGFLEWLGMKVIAIYPREEDLNPKMISHIIEIAKKEKPDLIVDNLQSGETGRVFEKELGIKRVTLSNFPLNSYFETLQKNIQILINAN